MKKPVTGSRRAAATRPARPGMRMDARTHRAISDIALALEGVETAPFFGFPAFKLNGHLVACPAAHPSAEMNSLIVPVSFEQREQLLAADPDVYYLQPHYENHAVVLVRVARLHEDGLRDLLRMVCQQIRARPPKKARKTRVTIPAARTKR